jgi:hypothetical protein
MLLQASAAIAEETKKANKSGSYTSRKARKAKRNENEFKRVSNAVLLHVNNCQPGVIHLLGRDLFGERISAAGRFLQKWWRQSSGPYLQSAFWNHRNYSFLLLVLPHSLICASNSCRTVTRDSVLE